MSYEKHEILEHTINKNHSDYSIDEICNRQLIKIKVMQ